MKSSLSSPNRTKPGILLPMRTLHITGGQPLRGSIRLGGAKNASYKLMIAALLASSESRLLNFSRIADVTTVADIINALGGRAAATGERAMVIDPTQVAMHELPPETGQQGRFSSMFIPVLLAKFGKAEVPLPGGDKIGARPLDRHFAGLEALGACITQTETGIHAETDGLVGTTYRFEKNSHTGTETLLMAAVLAKGTTTVENAAEEPEVNDLITFLNAMGAQITRSGRTITITGVDSLHGAIHKIMPDRNEAVSYACAALVTKGDIIIENANSKHLEAFLQKVEEINGGYEAGEYGIRFFYKGQLKATNVETQIHPGFMTDWQPLFTTVLTQCEGESILHETIMENRFQHVDNLREMGANITPFQPEVTDPEVMYNFNLADDTSGTPHAIKIVGPAQLHATTTEARDLRQGATILIAALAAEGTTTLTNITQIDRGYEELPERLISLGASITIEDTTS